MFQPEIPVVWNQARKLAETCGSILSSTHPTQVGTFLVEYPKPQESLDFKYQNLNPNDQNSGEINVTVGFSSNPPSDFGFIVSRERINGMKLVNFESLSVLDLDIGKRELWAGAVIEDDALVDAGIYPSVECDWMFNDPETKGELYFVRVNLSPDTHISYFSKPIFTNRVGDPYLLKGYPDRFEDLEQVIKRPIPMRIDYEKYAKQILERSMLKQFHQACLSLPHPPKF